MRKLAACYIVESDVRAEELERSLENIRPHVDAVFLTINNEPSKKIKELAKKYDCQWSFLAWNKDFSAQRNFNFEQAHRAGYEFLIWIDTDDTVDHPSWLRQLVKDWPEDLDGYVSTYDYAQDFGYTSVTHKRERLIRYNPKRMKWVGRVHEQLIMEQPFYVEETKSFRVIHHSKGEYTFEASAQTARRNLEILLSELKDQGKEPDPRTLIQIGRTYLGLGEAMTAEERDGSEFYSQAIPYLEQYVPLSGWDEERYEGICMLGRCLEKLGNLDAAEKFFYRALMELHNRYPAYEGLIRVYFQREDWPRVVFWYETMTNASVPETNHLNQELTTKMISTGYYVKALFLVGRFREAWQTWQQLIKKYGKHNAIKEETPLIEKAYHEALALEGTTFLAGYFQKYDKNRAAEFFKVLPKDLQHHELIANLKRKVLPPRVHAKNEVTIFCGQIGLEEWAYPSIMRGIGGSEEAVINMSQELTKLGYKVTVYNICGKMAGEYAGVTYIPFHEINPQDQFNVFIAWREASFCQYIKAKTKWLWLHDVPNPDAFTESVVGQIDKIMVLSEYHRSLLPHVPDKKIFISSNGVDMKMFDQEIKRDPKLVVYTSSPERGLEHFLTIAEEVKKEIPDVRFEAYYGWQNNDAARGGDPEYQDWKKKVNARIKKLGMPAYSRLSHRQIAAKMLEANIWLYPTDFPEISCIAAMKAQIAGAIPICSQFAALAETVRYGHVTGIAPDNIEALTKITLAVMKEDVTYRDEMMVWARDNLSWTKVAEQWVNEWLKK